MREYFEDANQVVSKIETCNCGNQLKLLEKPHIHTVSGIDTEEPSGTGEYTIQVFKILICPVCNSSTVILYSRSGNAFEDDDIEKEANAGGYPATFGYLRQVLYAPKRVLHEAIPSSITDVINQAESVLYNSPRASLILCGAVLEEICNDFGVDAKGVNKKGEPYILSLKVRLSKLVEIEPALVGIESIIDGIRILRNEGAHSNHLFVSQLSSKEAAGLIEIVNYIVERVYVDKFRQKNAEETLKNLKDKIL